MYQANRQTRNSTTKNKREQKQHSLSKPMIYTFSPPLATSYQKVPRKCIALDRRSGLIFRWWWSPEHSKDKAFGRRGRSRGCGWCRCCSSGVSNWQCRRPRTSWHPCKRMSRGPASPLIHVILELLHGSLYLCHLDVQVIESLFHDPL